jgi:hypothetical protein
MSDPVKHPSHYFHPSGIEVIDITRYETFLRGNILKYVLRAPYKGHELQDLKKAQQYLQWEIERIERAHKLGGEPALFDMVDTDEFSVAGLEEQG